MAGSAVIVEVVFTTSGLAEAQAGTDALQASLEAIAQQSQASISADWLAQLISGTSQASDGLNQLADSGQAAASSLGQIGGDGATGLQQIGSAAQDASTAMDATATSADSLGQALSSVSDADIATGLASAASAISDAEAAMTSLDGEVTNGESILASYGASAEGASEGAHGLGEAAHQAAEGTAAASETASVFTDILSEQGVPLATITEHLSSAKEGVLAFADAEKSGVEASDLLAAGLVGLAGVAIGKAVEGFTELATSVHEISETSGASEQTVQGLMYAMETLGQSGESASRPLILLQRSVDALGKQLEDGVQPTGRFADALQSLGIELRDFVALSPDQQIRALMDAFASAPESVNRTAAALAIFGRGGAEMLGVLEQGAAALDNGISKVNEYGASVDKSWDQVQRFHTAQADLTTAFQGLEVVLGSDILPTISHLTEGFADAVHVFEQLPGPVRDLAISLPLAAGAGLLAASAVSRIAEAAGGAVAGIVTLTAGEVAHTAATDVDTVAIEANTAAIEMNPIGLLVGAAIALGGTLLGVAGAFGHDTAATDTNTAATEKNTQAVKENAAARQVKDTADPHVMQDLIDTLTAAQSKLTAAEAQLKADSAAAMASGKSFDLVEEAQQVERLQHSVDQASTSLDGYALKTGSAVRASTLLKDGITTVDEANGKTTASTNVLATALTHLASTFGTAPALAHALALQRVSEALAQIGTSSATQAIATIRQALETAGVSADKLAAALSQLDGRPTQAELNLRAQIAETNAVIASQQAIIANATPYDQWAAGLQKAVDADTRTGASAKQLADDKGQLDAALANGDGTTAYVAAAQKRIDTLEPEKAAMDADNQALAANREAQGAVAESMAHTAATGDQLASVNNDVLNSLMGIPSAANDSASSIGRLPEAVTSATDALSTMAPAAGTAVADTGSTIATGLAVIHTDSAATGTAIGTDTIDAFAQGMADEGGVAESQAAAISHTVGDKLGDGKPDAISSGTGMVDSFTGGMADEGGVAEAEAAAISQAAGAAFSAGIDIAYANGVAVGSAFVAGLSAAAGAVADIASGSAAPAAGVASGIGGLFQHSFGGGGGARTAPTLPPPARATGGGGGGGGGGSGGGGGGGGGGGASPAVQEAKDEQGLADALSKVADAQRTLADLQQAGGTQWHSIAQTEVDDAQSAADGLKTAYVDALNQQITANNTLADDYANNRQDMIKEDKALADAADKNAQAAAKAYEDAAKKADAAWKALRAEMERPFVLQVDVDQADAKIQKALADLAGGGPGTHIQAATQAQVDAAKGQLTAAASNLESAVTAYAQANAAYQKLAHDPNADPEQLATAKTARDNAEKTLQALQGIYEQDKQNYDALLAAKADADKAFNQKTIDDAAAAATKEIEQRYAADRAKVASDTSLTAAEREAALSRLDGQHEADLQRVASAKNADQQVLASYQDAMRREGQAQDLLLAWQRQYFIDLENGADAATLQIDLDNMLAAQKTRDYWQQAISGPDGIIDEAKKATAALSGMGQAAQQAAAAATAAVHAASGASSGGGSGNSSGLSTGMGDIPNIQQNPFYVNAAGYGNLFAYPYAPSVGADIHNMEDPYAPGGPLGPPAAPPITAGAPVATPPPDNSGNWTAPVMPPGMTQQDLADPWAALQRLRSQLAPQASSGQASAGPVSNITVNVQMGNQSLAQAVAQGLTSGANLTVQVP